MPVFDTPFSPIYATIHHGIQNLQHLSVGCLICCVCCPLITRQHVLKEEDSSSCAPTWLALAGIYCVLFSEIELMPAYNYDSRHSEVRYLIG